MRRPGLQLRLLPSPHTFLETEVEPVAAVTVILMLPIMRLSDVTPKQHIHPNLTLAQPSVWTRRELQLWQLRTEAADLVAGQSGSPDSLLRFKLNGNRVTFTPLHLVSNAESPASRKMKNQAIDSIRFHRPTGHRFVIPEKNKGLTRTQARSSGTQSVSMSCPTLTPRTLNSARARLILDDAVCRSLPLAMTFTSRES